MVAGGEFTVDGGRSAAHVLLRRRSPPTAMFALSDEMAFGAIVAARDLGLTIPDDLSLIGVDDHEVSEVLGLSTVRQQVVEHGASAARALLVHLADGGASRRSGVTPPELVVRTSTGRIP